MTTVGKGWLANGLAGVRILGHLLTGPLLRRRRMCWGATPAEIKAQWPGTELIADPAWTATHAVTITAPAAQIWPWLAQLGQGRGGFYSYERLENLIGCQIHNVDRVLPEHQDIAAAAEVRLAPQMAMRVAQVEPDSDLVLVADSPTAGSPTADSQTADLHATDSEATGSSATPAGVWSLHLRPTHGGGTRLIERLSYARGDSLPERIFGSRHLIEPISFVMSKEMLRNIKALAEHGKVTSVSAERHVVDHTLA